MSPYAFKLVRLAGAALCSLAAIEGYFKFVSATKTVPPYAWLGLGGLGLAAYVLFYLLEIAELDKRTGFYVPARRLRTIDVPLAKALRIYPYYAYYGARREDELIRQHLKANGGVVIVGKPYSGKTRTALEAIVATQPRAFVLAFTSPDRLTQETIKEIVLPCFFIFFKKPRLTLLIDDVAKFTGKPFGELLAQLREQCSELTIVATCRTGIDERALADAQVGQLLRDVPTVELGPLDPDTAGKIRAEILRHGPAPLTTDMSLPGLIVFGPQEMRTKYLGLPPKRRRVITALRLAHTCGAVACERPLLSQILTHVLSQDVVGLDESIAALENDSIVMIDNTDRVAIQHEEFLYEDQRSYYQAFLDFKTDLNKLEELLVSARHEARLLQLGIFYWIVLRDLGAARRSMEASLRIKPSPLTNASLARLYAWLQQSERAREGITAAVEATKDSNEKALVLKVFADELLFNLADGKAAQEWYGLALQFATDAVTKAGVSFRYADCLVRLGRFREAEPRYRAYLAVAPTVDKAQATARLFLSVLARDGREARVLLREAWRTLPSAECLPLAFTVLENAEGFFGQAPSDLDNAWRAVWDEYCQRTVGAGGGANARDLLLHFADGALVRGFLAPAETSYRFLLDHEEDIGLAGRDLAATLIDLGATLRDRHRFAEARTAFDRARTLTASEPKMKNLLACAIAGLADCDLFETQAIFAAEPKYQQALDLARQMKDETALGWAAMGLGDVRVIERQFDRAKEVYGEPRLLGNSVSGRSRIHLGLARATLALGELDAAEYHVGTGFAWTARVDYQFRRKQFEELYHQIKKKREEAGAPPAADSAWVMPIPPADGT